MAKRKSVANKTAGQKPVAKAAAEASSEAAAVAPLPRVHPLVPAFVLFHVVAITLYALPRPSDAALNNAASTQWYRLSDWVDQGLKYNFQVTKLSVPIYGYLYPTGLWQYWDMFAPDPSQTDIWCDAEVTFLDGTKTTFKYPRIKALSIPEKFMQERHRKFYERVNSEKAPFYWMPFAQAIALKSATDPNSPPVQVTLVRHYQSVMRHDKQEKNEPPYLTYNFFSYIVDQHKLFADKGWKIGIH